jgi:GAF domain-containing protein
MEFGNAAVTGHDRATETVQDSYQRLAVSVASQLALSLASLQLREALREKSIRDPLTHLFNRRFLEESLEGNYKSLPVKSKPAAFGRCARAGPKPDAAANRGSHRALRSHQAGEREHGILPLRAGHYPDRRRCRRYLSLM